MQLRFLCLPLLMLATAAAPSSRLEVAIEQVRNHRGILHLCLTRSPAHFPDCGSDPKALKKSLAASTRLVRFDEVSPGGYALSVFHDENSNQKLDSFIGIPREGFGFSRNPVVRFGAPRFGQVRMDLAPGFSRQTVRMQYLL